MKKIFFVGLMSLFLSLLWINSSLACHYFDIDLTADAVYLGNGSWRYDYTLSDAGGSDCNFKEMSHWWIELPEHKIPTLGAYSPTRVETNFNEEQAPNELYTTLGNPFLGFHDGVKWESNQLITYSFTSTHGPVLDENGEIYREAYSWFAKSGGEGFYDYGTTLGPNGVVPEPMSLSLLGMGLLSLIGLKRKKA